jgi:hypothetical protein
MQLAISLFLISTGIIAFASIMDTLGRVPRLLAGLEAERIRLANKIEYTGPIYNRHDREVKP